MFGTGDPAEIAPDMREGVAERVLRVLGLETGPDFRATRLRRGDTRGVPSHLQRI